MGKKTAIAVGAVLGALIVLLLLVPALIDWSRYKGEITGRLEDALGRSVEISGPLHVRLLPTPAATAEGVRIGNLAGAQPADMASIPSLHLRLRLLPLLAGTVDVAALALDRPIVHLQRLADGRANWQFSPREKATPPANASPQANPPPGPPTANTSTGKTAAGAFHIGAIEISDGTLTYQSDGNAPLEVAGINLRSAMDSATGPYAAKGSARWHGVAVALDASLGELEAGRPAPLSLTLGLPEAQAKLTASGTVSEDASAKSAKPRLDGRLNLSAASPEVLARLLGGPASLRLPGPLSAEAKLAADPEEATLSDLAVTAGPIHASGNVTAAFMPSPRIDLALTVPSIDLDALANRPAEAPAAAQSAPPPATGGGGMTGSIPPPGAGGGTVAPQASGNFALPSGLFVNAELSVDTLSWHGRVARQARLQATLDQGELVVERAGLTLPGGTGVKAEGTLAAHHGAPAFDGHLDVRADDLREALAWLGIDTSAVSEDRLHRFLLSAAVAAGRQEVALEHMELGVDSVTASGRLGVALGGVRPAVSLAMAVDGVDLDAYLPRRQPAPPSETPPAQPQAAAPGETPQASTAAPPAASLPAPAFDTTLDLQVRHLIYRRVPAEDVVLSASMIDGDVAVRRAEALVAGSTVRATGALRGLGRGPARLDSFVLQLDSPQPGRLARVFGSTPPSELDRLGPLTAGASLTGGLETLTAKVRAAAGDVVVTADGTVADPLGDRKLDLEIGAHADSATRVIRLLSPDYRPRATLGPMVLSARVAGGTSALDVSGLDLKLGDARLTGSAQANLAGQHPVVTATLAGNAIDLDPFLTSERSGALIPVAPFPGGLHFPGVPAAGPARAVVPVAVTAAPAGSPLSTTPFDLSVLRAFNGVVDLKAEALTWKGWRLEGPVAHLVLDNGTATLDKLDGRLLGGTFGMTLRLSGGSLPQLTGALTVAGADLSHAGLGGGSVQLTQGKMDADARFAAAGRSSADMAARLGGDGKVTVRDGIIAGFDLPAVNQQMGDLKNIGSLLGVVQAGLSGGSTRFSSLAATFHAENGVVTTRDAKLDAEGGTATGVATVDLPRWTINSKVDIRLANGTSPPLGLRFEGPLGNPRKIIDVNELQRYMVEHGLGQALKGKGGQDLLGILGGQAPPQQSQQGQQQQQPAPTGRQLLQNLLKGLGGK